MRRASAYSRSMFQPTLAATRLRRRGGAPWIGSSKRRFSSGMTNRTVTIRAGEWHGGTKVEGG